MMSLNYAAIHVTEENLQLQTWDTCQTLKKTQHLDLQDYTGPAAV